MKIIKKKISELNIDDYIRQQKRIGEKIIFWNKKELLILKKFFKAATTKIDLNGVIIKNGFKFPVKKGFLFMGIKHFW